jgi:hypothetical protein
MMTKPFGFLFSALMLCAWMLPAQGGDPLAIPAANPVPSAGAVSKSPSAIPDHAVAAAPAPVDPKKRFRRPAPLKRLIFSAREGFSLRMVSSQEITAEIRNGAGRTLARGAYTLEAGDWTLRPRNLAPGLYTVLLRTGPQLRALRMKIEDTERAGGLPEWVLEKAPQSSGLQGASSGASGGASGAPHASPQQGASVFPAPD